MHLELQSKNKFAKHIAETIYQVQQATVKLGKHCSGYNEFNFNRSDTLT